MFLAIPPQPDCVSAWLAAVTQLDRSPGHEAHNVIIDVANPVHRADLSDPVVAHVNEFLRDRDKSIEAIANTIFPRALYHRHGSPEFIDVFHEKVLPRVRGNARWSGYYFERMTSLPVVGNVQPVDQLTRMIERINDPKNTSLNKHELSLFDPNRDVTGSPYGGQCLSFLSFHISPGANGKRTLLLTAQYRNHYYVEKLLGNLIGLGRLMEFVAKETGLRLGDLTIVSTHAVVDQPNASRPDITRLIDECIALAAVPVQSAA